ncbi:uncharacterized protein LOC110376921 [Helicoverpa armigera]|uniref:uncharacterized protein LOC110376921 n=1 Tax=Helicoverpa armigera TaxID=29058 RepID=UPI0030834A09
MFIYFSLSCKIVVNKLIETKVMDDLIAPQIKESCRLAMPDGLKELMSDISREVLRYQPQDLYQFIADYLSALLITRENLSIASHICGDMTQCGCEPELQHELKHLGVHEEDIIPARDIIVKCFEKGEVNESSLILKLLRETKIDPNIIPAVLEAIRNAFIRHEARKIVKCESSSECTYDDMMRAAKHTLNLYKGTAPSDEMYRIMAEKIQKTYRAYGVRRHMKPKDLSLKPPAKEGDTQADPNALPDSANTVSPKTLSSGTVSSDSLTEDPEIAMTLHMSKIRMKTLSSTSVAGSLVNLPHFKPYSADEQGLSDVEEYPEKEHAHMDYTADNPHFSVVYDDKEFFRRDRKISFSDTVPMGEKFELLGSDHHDVSIGLNNSNRSNTSNEKGFVKKVDSNTSSLNEIGSDVIRLEDSDNNNDDILEELR